ncbi:methyltransferase [Streptomyces daliensis]
MNTPAAYFADMYERADDPWGLAERWYERRKYALTVAALPRRAYRSAFEPACSVGVLSALLAERCARLLCCDRSERAVDAARRRLAPFHPHVRVERRVLPEEWPRERFDLVVLSELLYYFGPADAARLAGRAVDSLDPGGTLLAVHWRHPVPEHALSGDAAHEVLRAAPGLVGIVRHEEPDFVLEAFVRASPGQDAASVSVAADEGLT